MHNSHLFFITLLSSQALLSPLLTDRLNTTINYDDEVKYSVVTYGHAFMRGFESTNFAQNITQCYDSWVDFYYKELQQLEISMHYADTDDMIFNITHIISRVGDHLQTCSGFF